MVTGMKIRAAGLVEEEEEKEGWTGRWVRLEMASSRGAGAVEEEEKRKEKSMDRRLEGLEMRGHGH